MRLTQNQKTREFDIVVCSCCSKRLFCGIYCFMISMCDLFPKLMKVQTSKKRYNILIRRIMTFEYEKMLLLKLPQNNVASNFAITVQKEKVKVEIKLLIIQMSQ